MNTIEQVEKALITAGAGTTLKIKGYVNSSGETRDIECELLSDQGYWKMQREDLRRLQEADVADVVGEDLGDLQVADFIAAREQLMETKATSIKKHENGETDKRGPAYESIGGSLERHPTRPGLYLQRVKILGEIEEPKPAKGAVPRAKQQLGIRLDLPSRRYAHSLKFEDGKFESVEVLKMVEGSSLVS